MNYVYILRCSDDSLYTGWTTDLEKRVETHNRGQGAKYTRARRPASLVYFEEYEEKRDAQRREYQIKHKLSRQEKLALIEGADENRRGASVTFPEEKLEDEEKE